MAKDSKKSSDKPSKYIPQVSTKWREEYKRDNKYWNNRDEYNKAGELYARLDEMKEARRSNCYWGEDGGMHQSWDDHWDHMMKIWSMWHARPDEDDPRPNLKSTFAYNAVETAMTEMYDLNLMPAVLPWTTKGQKYAPVIENIIKYPILRYGFNDTWLEAFQEALMLGNAFMKVTYTKVVRTKKWKKLKDFSKEDLKKLEDGEVAIFQDKQVIQYNDVDWIHLPIQEYYPDPYARRQHGRHYAALDGIWERSMGFDAFKYEFSNKRGFVNIDKVMPGDDMKDDNPFFKWPENWHGSDNVVVQEWEDVINDRVRYTANGIYIGEMPMPNHGKLSVMHIGMVKFPHQYYYVGLVDVLEGLQTEDEVVRNKFLELLELVMAPPIIANNVVSGEFKDQFDSARYNTGEIISISGSPSEIQFMAPAITRMSEVFGLRAQIREDVIAVSLIDPKASAMPTKSPTAFEAMQMSAATMKGFAKTLKSFSQGISDGLKIQWAMQKQEYPLQMEPEDIEKRKGDKASSLLKSREIFSRDVKIIEADDKIEVIKKPGKDFPMEVKDKYFDLTEEDIDVMISSESQLPQSKAANVRKAEMAMTQLMPLFLQAIANPKMLQDQRVLTLLKQYVRAHGMDEDAIMEGEAEDPEDAVKRAEEQEAFMHKNAKVGFDNPAYKPVMGIFGEPLAHVNKHLETMAALNTLMQARSSRMAELDAKAQRITTEGGMIDPKMTEEKLELQEQYEFYEKFKKEMKDHITVDKLTQEKATEAILSAEAGMPPGQMPIGPGGPPGMPPMGPGQMGPGGMPMDPAMMPPGGPGGAPPMPGMPGGQMPNIPGPQSMSPQDMQAMAM